MNSREMRRLRLFLKKCLTNGGASYIIYENIFLSGAKVRMRFYFYCFYFYTVCDGVRHFAG